MCMVSAVYDQYNPWIPTPGPSVPPWQPIAPNPGLGTVGIMLTPEQLQQLLESFHKAVAAAKQADEAVGAKDCADPEKAKLEERVAELERRLDAMQKALLGAAAP